MNYEMILGATVVGGIILIGIIGFFYDPDITTEN